MHFNDLREMMESDSKETEGIDLNFEMENWPLFVSGLTTGCSKNPKFNVLYFSMWWANGVFLVRLNDRETDKTAYIEFETLHKLFDELELRLKSGRVVFREARKQEKDFVKG